MSLLPYCFLPPVRVAANTNTTTTTTTTIIIIIITDRRYGIGDINADIGAIVNSNRHRSRLYLHTLLCWIRSFLR